MRVKIMPPMVILALLRLITDSSSLDSHKEMGSRSTRELTAVGGEFTSVTKFGNISIKGRDFHSSVLLLDMMAKPDYKLTNISSDDLIGERVSFFTPDNLISYKNTTNMQTRTSAKMTWKSRITDDELPRIKRSEDLWIKSDISKNQKLIKMHAFIVRDENIPECGVTAEKTTKTRYFMCSGVILNHNHILTSASCINSAEIDENHIEAHLAVLIGALSQRSYVIKIQYYEIHPEYVPDPQSATYAKNNVAMLTLSCPIPRQLVITPKLPTQYYDDVGHICCPDRCTILTVVQDLKNFHTIREMKAQHLPPPIHDDNDNNLYRVKSFPINLEMVNLKSSNLLTPRSLKRKYREPGLAPIPQFFTQDMADKIKSKYSKSSKQKEILVSLRDSDMPAVDETKDKVDESATTTNAPEAEVKTEDAGSEKGDIIKDIDWDLIRQEIANNNVTEENKDKLTSFTTNSMSDLMEKLLQAMTEHLADTTNIYALFSKILNETPSGDNNKTSNNIAVDMGKKMLKYAIEELDLSDSSENKKNDSKDVNEKLSSNATDATNNTKIDEGKNNTTQSNKNETDKAALSKGDVKNGTDSNSTCNKPKSSPIEFPITNATIEKNVYCPPLGSPVISNNTLIALIADTCDDLQNWVEWKYVEISHNIHWIKSQLKKSKTIPVNGDDNMY